MTALSVDLKARIRSSEFRLFRRCRRTLQGENDDAEIHVHPYGRFLYTSNRGHDSIAVFAIDPVKGTLTVIENISTQGKIPRSFEIDPTGKFLFAENEKSNNIVIFRIDEKTGRLPPTGQKLEVSEPVA